MSVYIWYSRVVYLYTQHLQLIAPDEDDDASVDELVQQKVMAIAIKTATTTIVATK